MFSRMSAVGTPPLAWRRRSSRDSASSEAPFGSGGWGEPGLIFSAHRIAAARPLLVDHRGLLDEARAADRDHEVPVRIHVERVRTVELQRDRGGIGARAHHEVVFQS